MTKYTVITYRLNKTVKPSEVLSVIESLMQQHPARHKTCLFKADISIIEYEFEGKMHSNRKKNAILSICKKHPELEPFVKHTAIDKGDGHISEKLSLSNFSDANYLPRGETDYSIVRDVVTKIPRPYGVNDLELIFDGITFSKENNDGERIKPSTSGCGAPIGNYILYERSSYGSEKNSYVCFSADDAILDEMRNLYFDFSKKIPGKYEGTEIRSV